MHTIKLTESQLHSIIADKVNEMLIKEAFKSDSIRDFFKQHGGVNTRYRQFSLGDINDSQIGYSEEFDNVNDAIDKRHKLLKSGYDRKRSDYDMKYLFQIYVANDGTALLIGIDRNSIDTVINWGGEHEKKVGDRLWRNGWNYKIRDNKYVDDSDTYYYQSPANDFGVHNSQQYQFRKQDNQRALERQPEGTKEKFKQDKIKHLRDYIKKYYPETFEKLMKNK